MGPAVWLAASDSTANRASATIFSSGDARCGEKHAPPARESRRRPPMVKMSVTRSTYRRRKQGGRMDLDHRTDETNRRGFMTIGSGVTGAAVARHIATITAARPAHPPPGWLWPERRVCLAPFLRLHEADLREALADVAGLPARLGEEHRLVVDVAGHLRPVLAGVVVEVRLGPP